MGVAGSGKTTIGALLASELGCRFWDADSFHSAANIEKMRQGIPLTDADRTPWLVTLRDQVVHAVAGKTMGVLACSSLKARYREMLAEGTDRVRFVYLRVTPELARRRLATRPPHFMNPELVENQFAELDEPPDAVVVDGSLSPPQILEAILRGLNGRAIAHATDGMPAQETVSLEAATLASLRSAWAEVVPDKAFDADRSVALLVNRLRHYEETLWRIVENPDALKALMAHQRATGQETEPGAENRLDGLRKAAQIAGVALSPPRWLVSRGLPSSPDDKPASD
jgi:gluconokinase